MWQATINRSRALLVALASVALGIVQVAHLLGSSIADRNAVDIAAIALNLNSEMPGVLWAFLGSIAPLMTTILAARAVRSWGWQGFPNRIAAVVITIYYSVSAVLLVYRFETGVPFDASILLDHLDNTIRTIAVLSGQYPGLFPAISLVVALHYYGVMLCLNRVATVEPRLTRSRASQLVGLGVLGVFACSWNSQMNADHGLGGLIFSLFETNSNAKTIYGQYFRDSIERNRKQKLRAPGPATSANLFMFQLESVNARLIEDGHAPRFVATAREKGIFFPRMQSASVFTILSMETILCSVLPPLEKNIAQQEDIFRNLACLPKLLKAAGYRTLYFQSFPDLNYNNNEAFLRGIGFEEVHAESIMKSGDPLLKWGYAEDVFYRRVFAYLERFKGEKLFVYILTCSTNHYPFYDDEKRKAYPQFTTRVPYPQAKNDRQRMANTTWIQDRFFGQMYDELLLPTYGLNSHAVVFGDHSWPIEIHKGNHHNLNLAYEENFVTSMSILPAHGSAGEPYQKGKVVTARRSQLDIAPTILEMYGLGTFDYYGSSFLGDFITGDETSARPRCVVAAQPFSGGYITITEFPIKHIFNLKKRTVSRFDLERDPDEMSPGREVPLDGEQVTLLENCLRSLRDGRSGKAPLW